MSPVLRMAYEKRAAYLVSCPQRGKTRTRLGVHAANCHEIRKLDICIICIYTARQNMRGPPHKTYARLPLRCPLEDMTCLVCGVVLYDMHTLLNNHWSRYRWDPAQNSSPPIPKRIRVSLGFCTASRAPLSICASVCKEKLRKRPLQPDR